MREQLETKVKETVKSLREAWTRLEGKRRFVAFSTGKDSLALAAMLYEAVAPERPQCLYAHHDLEFPCNVEYLQELRERGFAVEVVKPFLEYFELIQRGIGFLTLWDIEEAAADAVMKRMLNCLDCGFCVLECFPCRHFDRERKELLITGCIQCGKCVRVKFCMGWRHRFWRRVIVEDGQDG